MVGVHAYVAQDSQAEFVGFFLMQFLLIARVSVPVLQFGFTKPLFQCVGGYNTPGRPWADWTVRPTWAFICRRKANAMNVYNFRANTWLRHVYHYCNITVVTVTISSSGETCTICS
jgi:hypothetical protein